MNRKGRSIFVLLVVMSTLLLVTTQPIKAEDLQQKEIEFTLGPEHASNAATEGVDLKNPKKEQVNFMKWNLDWHEEHKNAPKGTYVGQYLSPSILELDYKCGKEEEITTVDQDTILTKYNSGELNIAVVSEVFQFSHDEIMNGASRFWVKAPVSYNSLEVFEYVNEEEVSDFSGDDSYTQRRTTTVHSGLYMFEGEHRSFGISGEMTSGLFDLRGESINSIEQSRYSRANYIINEENNYNNSVYERMNVIVEPEVNYTFAFLILTEGKPRVHMDEISSTTAALNMMDLNVEGELEEKYHYEFSIKNGRTENLHASPHFSFIFTHGYGRNNLFGTSLEKETDVSIFGSIDSSEVQGGYYPSFYLPFKYDSVEKGINPDIKVMLADSQGVLLEDTDIGSGALYEWESTENYSFVFDRYFLYSTEKYWHGYDSSVYNGDIKYVSRYSNLPKNFTFMCKERKSDYLYEKTSIGRLVTTGGFMNPSTSKVITHHWLGESWRTGNLDEVLVTKKDSWSDIEIEETANYTNISINTELSYDRETDYNKISERFFYDIHQATEFTEGRWNTIKMPPKVEYIGAKEAVERGIPNGTTLRTRHRDYIIKVEGDTEYYINKLNEQSNRETWADVIPDNPWQHPLKTMMALGGFLLRNIKRIVGDIAKEIVDAAGKIVGSIASFFEGIWKKITDIGKWIKRVVLKVTDVLIRLAGQLYKLAGMQLQALQYTLGIMALILGTYAVIVVTSEVKGYAGRSAQ